MWVDLASSRFFFVEFPAFETAFELVFFSLRVLPVTPKSYPPYPTSVAAAGSFPRGQLIRRNEGDDRERVRVCGVCNLFDFVSMVHYGYDEVL